MLPYMRRTKTVPIITKRHRMRNRLQCKKRPRSLEFHGNRTQSCLDCGFVNVKNCLFSFHVSSSGSIIEKWILFTLGSGRLLQKKKKIFDTTTIYGICTTQDVDLFLKHMNNARYLRELDFARFHYYDRTGIYAAIAKRGGGAVQGASSTRYRRALPIFTPYKVTTKLIYWEDKHFYLEHEFISLTDNFVRAVVLSRQTITGLKIPVTEIITEIEPNAQRPALTKDLELWLSSMEESSQRYKKDN